MKYIVFENGMMLWASSTINYGDLDTLDLNQFCDIDLVVDIALLENSIYALLPDRCIRLLYNSNTGDLTLYSEFGNSEEDSVRLISANSISIDNYNGILILDSSDRSVKLYSNSGLYYERWELEGEPSNIEAIHERFIYIDKQDNSIKSYSMLSESVITLFNYDQLGIDSIKAFKPIDDYNLFILSGAGDKLVTIDTLVNIPEEYAEVCYQDVYFDFGEIADIGIADAFYSKQIVLLDNHSQLLIELEIPFYDEVVK